MLEENLKELTKAVQELTKAVLTRAEASNNLTKAVEDKSTVEPKKAEPVVEEKKAEPVVEEPKGREITIVEVRQILTQARAQGKGAQVAALVKSYGVTSLDKIPKDKYPELLEKGQEL